MFYDRFKLLCKRKGISCTKAATENGFSNSTPTKWKKTAATPEGSTISVFADYFKVPVEYLMGLTTQSQIDEYTFRLAELEKALKAESTPPCETSRCSRCGVCGNEKIASVFSTPEYL